MNILDIAPSPWTSVRLIVGEDSTRRVAAIFDATGSWGLGPAAIDFVTAKLQPLWIASPPSPERVVDALLEQLRGLPPEIQNHEDDHAFSFAAVVVEANEIAVVSCGWYGAAEAIGNAVSSVHRPNMWVDDQVSEGNLSAPDAEVHPLRHVYAGPVIGTTPAPAITRLQFAPTSTVIVAETTVLRKLEQGNLSAAAVQALAPDRPHAVIIARPAV